MNYAAMRYLTEGDCPVEGAAWQVVAVIAWHADKTSGEAYLSRRRIAQEARLSTSTVHEALSMLIGRGVLELVLTGAGRRSTTYRICVPTVPVSQTVSDSPTESQADPVMARLADRSGSVDPPVVTRWADAYIGGREEQEGFEGRASTAPPDGGASRSEEPATVPDWRAALNGQGSRARPVSAAAAQAQQAAPDTAARPTRRTTRGRKGRRGREPPARCTRSNPKVERCPRYGGPVKETR